MSYDIIRDPIDRRPHDSMHWMTIRPATKHITLGHTSSFACVCVVLTTYISRSITASAAAVS